jgi:beta-N-acetylhexosaminidase
VAELRRTWAFREPGRDADQERHHDGAVVAAGRAASLEVATAVVGTVAGTVPAMPGATVIHVERQANAAVGETAWGLPSLGGPVLRRSGSDLPGSPLPAGPVVLVVRGATVDEEVWSWVRAVLASNSQAWLVELGWPDPQLDGLDRVVRTWGSAGVLTEALSRALRGRS